ncbi:MFS transporter [Nocardioides caeni]|nr:MFS transporter [Nocardioides caeni]
MTDTQPSGLPDEVAADKAPTEARTRHAAWALVLICSAQLMVVLDSTIANIALPYIGKDLDIDQANLSWIVTGYALAFGGLLLLGGRLGDLFGRRRVFMVGVVLFAVASALGGLATHEWMLLTSRGLQGLGAALASPTALALITTTFPAGPQRNRAFSVFAAMSGIGAAIGLVLGGWLTGLDDELGWRLTFLINVPIGLVAAYFAPKLLPDTDHHAGKLDLPGAVLGTGGLLALVYGITRTSNTDPDTVTLANPAGTTYGWGDSIALGAIALGVVALIAFVLYETRARQPLMPLSIFASRSRAVAMVSMMMTPAAMFAMFFFLSLYVQDVMGYEPLQTGFAFLPFAFGMVFGATASSKLVSKVDPRYLAGTGTILAGTALFAFSRIEYGAENYWTDIMPFVVLMSLGMGLTFVPMTLVALHGVRAEDAGIGSGVLNTMQQVGGALGLATLSAVASHYATEKLGDLATSGTAGPDAGLQAFADGATHAFLVGAFMIWAASLIIWALLNVKHTELATDEAPEGVHVG